jgi:hypothetical protein
MLRSSCPSIQPIEPTLRAKSLDPGTQAREARKPGPPRADTQEPILSRPDGQSCLARSCSDPMAGAPKLGPVPSSNGVPPPGKPAPNASTRSPFLYQLPPETCWVGPCDRGNPHQLYLGVQTDSQGLMDQVALIMATNR